MEAQKVGTPVCLNILVTAAIATIYTAPANKRLIIDQIEITDISAAANMLTLADRYVLAIGGGAITDQKATPAVVANGFLQIPLIEDLVILNELRAVSTGNMNVSIRGREV